METNRFRVQSVLTDSMWLCNMVKLLDKDLAEMVINRHENKINRGHNERGSFGRLLREKGGYDE